MTLRPPADVPTFVIHCAELPERTSAARAVMQAHAVDAKFFRSVHGKTWGIETTREYEPGHRISPGHVGLNLGHYFLWQHLWLSGYETALILEDDITFPDDWHRKLQQVLDELTRDVPDWQLCFVGLAEVEPHVWTKVTERIGGADSRLCRLCDPFGTHAYLVRRSALPVLLDRMTVAERNMDQQLYQRVLKDNRITWCAVLPTLVKQRTFDYELSGKPEWAPSTIDPDTRPPAPTPAGQPEGRYVGDVKSLLGGTPIQDPPGRPSPLTIACTTPIVDPYPCIYRGEFTDDPAVNAAGRTVPVSVCGRLSVICHDRNPEFPGMSKVVSHRGVPVTSCAGCEIRTQMGTSESRSRLPVPEGHFNPSIHQWGRDLILATRDSWGHSRVALWKLHNTDRHGWTGTWTVEPISSIASAHPDAPRLEDPRLFAARDDRGMPYLGAMFNLPDGYPPKRVQVGYVRFSDDLKSITHTEVFRSPHNNLYEKNWVPFWDTRGDELRWVYASKPRHTVLGRQSWETPNPFPWAGGVIRGGAAPVSVTRPDGREEWYHFFHGCLKRLQGSVYTMGCAVFEPHPPFRILRQTAAPLLWPDLPAPGEEVVKRYVVWPGGAVLHGGSWHIALGVDDTFCRIVRIPVTEVEAAMTDVPEEEPAVSLRDTPLATGVLSENR